MTSRSNNPVHTILRARQFAGTLVLASGLMATIGCGVPAPQAQLVFKDLRAAMLSVSGTSSDDVYMVGADLGEGKGPNVLHFDGRRWRRMSTGLDGGHLWWISVMPIDGAFYLAGDPGLLVRFDPRVGTFTRIEMPDPRALFGVWGTAADDLWTVGGDLDQPDTGGVIRYFDGQTWSDQNVSEALPDGVPTLYKVWGRSKTEVYVVGRLGTLLHFDGQTWTKLDSGTTRTLFTIHGNDTLTAACGGSGDGVIIESSGGAFTNRAAPGTPQMNGVCVPMEAAPVTAGSEAALAFRDDADGWKVKDTALDTFRDLHAVWVDPDGGVWAVGGNLSDELDEGIVVYYGTRTIPTTIGG